MSTISLRLPDSIHQKIKELAASDGTSINQFLATAAAEKVAALETEHYLPNVSGRVDVSDSWSCWHRPRM